MKVEILYFSGCPNHAPAMECARAALAQEDAGRTGRNRGEGRGHRAKDRLPGLSHHSGEWAGCGARGARGAGVRPVVPHVHRWRPSRRGAATGMDSSSGARGEGEILDMRVAERLSPVAAALSALATLACCLPLGIAGAVGALGLSVALEALRPWLIGLALVLLDFSAFEMCRNGRSCRRVAGLSLVLFGLSAAIVVGVISFRRLSLRCWRRYVRVWP